MSVSRTVAQDVWTPWLTSVFSIEISRWQAGTQRKCSLRAAPARPGLHLGHERFQFGVRAGEGEQILLAGESVLEFAGEFEPLLFGTRGEVAEGADDLLAGAFGSEVAFDEDNGEMAARQVDTISGPLEISQLKTRELHRSVNRNPPENRSHPPVVARKLS